MSYKIILDSCGELTEEMALSGHFTNVPLTLGVGEYRVVDDETFNQAAFLNAVASTTACPKSACPSPEQFMKAYDCGCSRIYVFTLSEQLSGSYNSAMLAKKLYEEINPYVKIYVFNSRSASAGETIEAAKVMEFEKQELSFEEIVKKTEEYISNISTYFVLEDLSFLERNGRLTGVKKIAANLLHIVPIMAGSKEGTIYQVGQARGINKALTKLINLICEECEKKKTQTLIIAQCNCMGRALDIRERILAVIPDLKIVINATRGVSSLYAGNGGIIFAFD